MSGSAIDSSGFLHWNRKKKTRWRPWGLGKININGEDTEAGREGKKRQERLRRRSRELQNLALPELRPASGRRRTDSDLLSRDSRSPEFLGHAMKKTARDAKAAKMSFVSCNRVADPVSSAT